MRPALRRQRNARWRCHHHEPRILVAGVVQRIEAALDEGIVQGRNRQQPFAVDMMRQPERRHQDEQIHFGDAEFDVLALWGKVPIEGRRYLLTSKEVSLLGACQQAPAVDPGTGSGRPTTVKVWRDYRGMQVRVTAPSA